LYEKKSNHKHLNNKIMASPININDVRIAEVRNTESGYRMRIYLFDGKSITRKVDGNEARQYFKLNAEFQKKYVVELFNAKYRASQFTAAQYAAARCPMSADEERFLSLRAQRKINALPTEEEREYQALKSKLENS
jgi:hypothetical protein